jgi:hypothetical protein
MTVNSFQAAVHSRNLSTLLVAGARWTSFAGVVHATVAGLRFELSQPGLPAWRLRVVDGNGVTVGDYWAGQAGIDSTNIPRLAAAALAAAGPPT